jgi:O-antigen/teichoic acid export membrane protein
MPFILLIGFARAICYVTLRPALATQGALIYAALVLAGCSLVQHFGHLTPGRAFILMGAGGAVATAYLLCRVRPVMSTRLVRSAALEHWRFGRWGLASLPVYWAMENMSYLLSGAFLGMREVGAARAIANTLLPLGQMTSAVGRLVQPHVSNEFRVRGATGVAAWTRSLALVLTASCLAYLGLTVAFDKEIVRLLYGSKFVDYAHLIPLASASVSIYIVYQAFSIGLRALHNPKPLLLAYVCASIVSLAAGLVGVKLAGLTGLMIAAAFSNLTALAITGVSFYRTVREHEAPPDECVLESIRAVGENAR